MPFANNTQINVNTNTQKAINDIQVGDKIFAAAYDAPSQWNEQTVNFSSGTPDGNQENMVYIRFTDHNNEGQIIVTPDQPFLLSTKEIKQALKLIPGGDLLLSATGSTLQILNLQMGMYRGGVHDIAFNTGQKGNWIIAAGVVCGDYIITLHQSK